MDFQGAETAELVQVQLAWLAGENEYRDQELTTTDYRNQTQTNVDVYDGEFGSITPGLTRKSGHPCFRRQESQDTHVLEGKRKSGHAYPKTLTFSWVFLFIPRKCLFQILVENDVLNQFVDCLAHDLGPGFDIAGSGLLFIVAGVA